MNLADILILLVLAVIVFSIIWRMRSNRKKGKSNICGCNCEGCSAGCHSKNKHIES